MAGNLGKTEQRIRVGLGLLLLAIGGATWLPGLGTTLVLLIGIMALVTGSAGYCPLWRVLGIDTDHDTHANSHGGNHFSLN